jgi:hypothetical protein
MTSSSDPLDRLVSAAWWVADWDDVLQRAGKPDHRLRLAAIRILTRRRLVLVIAVLVAALVPLGAVGAANDWWFLRFGAGSTPDVVKEGVWNGHPWKLIAYPSNGNGLCFSMKWTDSQGGGHPTACAPFALVAGPAQKAPPEMTITWMAATRGSSDFPPFIVGPVIGSATQVEITFVNGDVLRVPTFAAPTPLTAVGFYAAQLPAAVARLPVPGPIVQTLAGLDAGGNVVACLAPQTAVAGISPLSDCK